MRSQNQSGSGQPTQSTEKSREFSGGISQIPLEFDRNATLPGSYNDSFVVRSVLIEAIRKSGKSRETIAEEMSYLVGREVTPRQLNGFTAESKEDYKFPAELDRAFCKVTGDNRLLTCRVERAGFHVVTDEDMLLLDLGRQHLIRIQAEEQIANLQQKLRGRVA